MAVLDLQFADGRFVLSVQLAPDREVRLPLDQDSVERLLAACIRLLATEGTAHPGPREGQEPLLDYLVESLATGVDGSGLPLIQAEIGNLRPLRLRFGDDAARLIVQSFTETLSSPQDVRTTKRPN